MQTGKIGVTSENLFPIIKKFLYSDHDIFLREIVSNAVDATQKLKTLASKGEYNGDVTNAKVRVKLDKEAKTITVSDSGIGMTAEEIEKYINQIAFSGANDFLEKHKDDANTIIGHFGLGFYSSFMVSEKVEIITKSYKEGAQAVKWSCTGSPEFTLDDAERDDVLPHPPLLLIDVRVSACQGAPALVKTLSITFDRRMAESELPMTRLRGGAASGQQISNCPSASPRM